MKYSLDTNTCIRYLTGRSSNVVKRVQSTPANEIVVCDVVRSELFFGAAKSDQPQRTLAKQLEFLQPYLALPFDTKAALVFGQLRAELENAGRPIGAYDMQIAAIAITNDLILVTHNLREFSRIKGLRIEDWES